MREIVVGVDGSPGAGHALGWAAAYAAPGEQRLRLVHAHVPYSRQYPFDLTAAGPGLDAAEARGRAAAESVLADAAARVRAEADVDVVTELVEGDAAQALLERSAGADLLVVGARGLGGFAGLLLGSVSQRCVQHASCPVVVIPQR